MANSRSQEGDAPRQNEGYRCIPYTIIGRNGVIFEASNLPRTSSVFDTLFDTWLIHRDSFRRSPSIVDTIDRRSTYHFRTYRRVDVDSTFVPVFFGIRWPSLCPLFVWFKCQVSTLYIGSCTIATACPFLVKLSFSLSHDIASSSSTSSSSSSILNEIHFFQYKIDIANFKTLYVRTLVQLKLFCFNNFIDSNLAVPPWRLLLVLLTRRSTVVRMIRRLAAPGVKRPLTLSRNALPSYHSFVRHSFFRIDWFSCEPTIIVTSIIRCNPESPPLNDRARGAIPQSWLPTVVPAPQGHAFVG